MLACAGVEMVSVSFSYLYNRYFARSCLLLQTSIDDGNTYGQQNLMSNVSVREWEKERTQSVDAHAQFSSISLSTYKSMAIFVIWKQITLRERDEARWTT